MYVRLWFSRILQLGQLKFKGKIVIFHHLRSWGRRGSFIQHRKINWRFLNNQSIVKDWVRRRPKEIFGAAHVKIEETLRFILKEWLSSRFEGLNLGCHSLSAASRIVERLGFVEVFQVSRNNTGVNNFTNNWYSKSNKTPLNQVFGRRLVH